MSGLFDSAQCSATAANINLAWPPMPVWVVCLKQVLLTDADLAITAAVAKCWVTTLHLYCLWHVFKNVIKKCSSSFADNDDRSEMLRLFRSAAYAATPEVGNIIRAFTPNCFSRICLVHSYQ